MQTRDEVEDLHNCREFTQPLSCLYQAMQTRKTFSITLRWLNTVLAVCEYMSFGKSWQGKGCSSQAETWQVKNILMKDFD